jgi:hypothetical protein
MTVTLYVHHWKYVTIIKEKTFAYETNILPGIYTYVYVRGLQIAALVFPQLVHT